MFLSAQEPSIAKGAIVVPKFALKWSDFDSSWRGSLKAELIVEKNDSGKLTINGNDNWGEIPFFPAFDLSPKGLATALYKMEYSRPTMVGYKIDGV